MSVPDQEAAVITGASQGIGAGLVDAYGSWNRLRIRPHPLNHCPRQTQEAL
ncbi:hypothetical protein ACF08M_39395 [Streptomyces sp. NPDC015032]|uniref:hypothetical protein n=1 Tax=Streptomyces sp. NPDC015032 TaxID=3364937 RepID=UPI00370342E2